MKPLTDGDTATTMERRDLIRPAVAVPGLLALLVTVIELAKASV
jgi:hypothetical protein